MLSATRLTVALTMKTNTLVFSIGFQYIRQLAKFGRKEGIFYPEPAAIFLHFALFSPLHFFSIAAIFLHSTSFIQSLLPFFSTLHFKLEVVEMSCSRFSFSTTPWTMVSIFFRQKLPLFYVLFYIFFISGFHFSAPQSVTVPLGSYYPRLLSHCPPAVHIDCQKPLSGGEVPKYPSVWHSVTILVGQKSPGLSLR